jgi:hypothetical protein
MLFLKLSWRLALFGTGLAVSGDWHRVVLDHYAVNCTLLRIRLPIHITCACSRRDNSQSRG